MGDGTPKSTLTEHELNLLEEQLYEFNRLWHEAEKDAWVDTPGGLEWRISVLLFLTMPADDRATWMMRPEQWKLDHLSWLRA